MKLLAVGNSFSQDACTFLHQTAQAQGLDLEVTNLYIGGCSLEMHYQNLLSGKTITGVTDAEIAAWRPIVC